MTTEDVFEGAFAFLVKHEGGYAFDPRDPGGETCYGLSRRWHPNLDLENLTEAEAREVYHREYWKPGNFAALPAPVAIKVFDMCVNMGFRAGVRKLQRSLNYLKVLEESLRLDGVIGRLTDDATTRVWQLMPDDLMHALVGYHFDHYRRLVESDSTHYEVFARGWLRRAFDTP